MSSLRRDVRICFTIHEGWDGLLDGDEALQLCHFGSGEFYMS